MLVKTKYMRIKVLKKYFLLLYWTKVLQRNRKIKEGNIFCLFVINFRHLQVRLKCSIIKCIINATNIFKDICTLILLVFFTFNHKKYSIKSNKDFITNKAIKNILFTRCKWQQFYILCSRSTVLSWLIFWTERQMIINHLASTKHLKTQPAQMCLTVQALHMITAIKFFNNSFTRWAILAFRFIFFYPCLK